MNPKQIELALTDHAAVEDLAAQLQPVVQDALDTLPHGLAAFLQGETTGHPLHPVLVHLPLGGWLTAALLDFAPGHENRQQAADLALLLSTLGAVPTVAAGWADWSRTRRQARRTGLVHGTLEETALLLSAASVLARRQGRRGLGKALSAGGLGLALLGGMLGGELVYGHGVGVRR